MKRELRRWEIVGFIATGLFGTLLHFVYEWTGGNRVIAVFSAVNESTWEHMKLLFIPFLPEHHCHLVILHLFRQRQSLMLSFSM